MDLNVKQDFLLKLQTAIHKGNQTAHQVFLGSNYIAIVNYGKHLKGLCPSLQEDLNGFDVEVEQIWVKPSKQMANVGNSRMRVDRLDVFEEEPIISCDCVHAIMVVSENRDMLKYANKVAIRYLNNYSRVLKLEQSVFPKSEIKLDALDLCNKNKVYAPAKKPKVKVHKKTFKEKLKNKLIKIIKLLLS